MTTSVFIDGGHGTTGLEIRERLAGRHDIAVIELDDALRKDTAVRRDALHSADIVILCLPDDAAREAVRLAGDTDVRFIDASTAHRTDPDWIYGFPEMETGWTGRIASAKHVANPGCYAQTAIALLRPLVREGLLPADTLLTINAASGYSGGGRALIEEFGAGTAHTAFRNYALGLAHKHLPEIRYHARIDRTPLFSPSVVDSYRGMIVEIPLFAEQFASGTMADSVRACYRAAYGQSRTVTLGNDAILETLDIERCANTDRMEIFVFDNPESSQMRIAAALDNLGKGAAGAAVQNLNLMTGNDQYRGLRL